MRNGCRQLLARPLNLSFLQFHPFPLSNLPIYLTKSINSSLVTACSLIIAQLSPTSLLFHRFSCMPLWSRAKTVAHSLFFCPLFSIPRLPFKMSVSCNSPLGHLKSLSSLPALQLGLISFVSSFHLADSTVVSRPEIPAHLLNPLLILYLYNLHCLFYSCYFYYFLLPSLSPAMSVYVNTLGNTLI